MGENPPVADLHLHMAASDGRLAIDALPGAVRTGGVDVVAVTDHDRCHPKLDVPIVEHDGVAAVRDIELRVDAGDRRVGLPGYGLRERPALAETVERLQRDRVERAREIVMTIEGEAGIRLEVDIHDDIDRSYVTCAAGASKAPYDYRGAFDELIGADGPCYAMRGLSTFDDGAAALRDACDVVDLIHPFRCRGPVGALELCADSNAVERYYPHSFDVEADLVEEAVERYDLFVMGGSDAHDETLDHTEPSKTGLAQLTAVVDDL